MASFGAGASWEPSRQGRFLAGEINVTHGASFADPANPRLYQDYILSSDSLDFAFDSYGF